MVNQVTQIDIRPLTAAQLGRLSLAGGVANPFYDPAQIAIALTTLGQPDDLLLLGGYDVNEHMVGFIPLVKDHTLARLPITYWRNWIHPFCFLGAAPIVPGLEQDFYHALFSWLDHETNLPLLRLTHVPRQAGILTMVGERRVLYRAAHHQRAILAPQNRDALSGETYIKQTVRAKKRKEIRRLRNRLSEQGKVTYREWQPIDPMAPWLQRFFALEAKGWKGKQGSAIANDPRQVNYFHQACALAGERKQLFMAELALDDHVLAAMLGFIENNILFTVKIAYDEAYRRFSPGVMLELAITKSALDHHRFTMVDSCAKPNHSMIDHLWAERMDIEQWVIGLQGWRGNQLARLCQGVERLGARIAGRNSQPQSMRGT